MSARKEENAAWREAPVDCDCGAMGGRLGAHREECASQHYVTITRGHLAWLRDRAEVARRVSVFHRNWFPEGCCVTDEPDLVNMERHLREALDAKRSLPGERP